MSKSNQSPGQVLQFSYDPNNEALKVVPVSGPIVTEPYDYISVTYPTSSQEVYMFYSGGMSGMLVSTVTINYTDSTKANLLNVSRT